ncbi:O132 family O-antigen flippase [Escherichia coli]|nr:O132 family O-antigen flippase [Escherichia coli]EJZ1101242.1 O132 family O-antigen flippase [Escherichia coli]EJZ1455357.1 O132 family O-antigen flippase [Escherichia coli]EKE9510444.1 O132 family O-antigen flippase [Escherichia coli]HAW1878201.1 O132 family O-antigen flippase [Escherichia coli]
MIYMNVIKSRVFLNAVYLFFVQGVTYLVPLITLPYLVRVLGAQSYGVLSFSLAIIQYFILLTDYGFNLSATQKISVICGDINKISNVFWSVTCCKILLMIISAILVYTVTKVFDVMNGHELVIFSCFGLVLGNILFPVWFFQGKEQMGLSSISNIISKLLAIPLIFLLVNNPNDAWIAAIITSFTSISGGLISLTIIYHKKWVHWVGIRDLKIIQEFKDGWHLFISTAAISMYTTSIVVVLGIFSGPISVGYFTAADRIRQAVQGLITPITQACYPRINYLYRTSPEKGFELVRKLLYFQGGITLTLSIILMMFASVIVKILFGNGFERSDSVLTIMAFCPFIVGISNVLGIQILVALGYKKVFSKILLCSGGLCLILIGPSTYLYSENGAALSVLITEVFVTIAMLIVVLAKKVPIFKRENLNNEV